MSLALFDSHAFVKRLTAVGMPEEQAEVLADEHGRQLDGRLATKADIAPLATNADFPVAKNDLQRQI
jgi:hypothetical protein